MGGNALKHLGVRRRDSEEYLALKTYVLDIIKEYYELVATPLESPGKTSFGDLDILVASARPRKGHPHKDPRFRSRGFSKNGNVLSFEHDDFQIDLIHVKKQSFELSKTYFHGDFGVLLGKLARNYGLYFGHESFGIKYPCKEGVLPFELSRDVSATLQFLGFPPFPTCGFADDAELVEYLSSGRMDVRFLKGSKLRRDRPSFERVVKMIEAFEGDPPESDMRDDAAAYFDKAGDYDVFKEDIRQREHLHQVFNGAIVRAATGFDGLRLGAFMKKFKETYSTTRILELAESNTLKDVIKTFKEMEMVFEYARTRERMMDHKIAMVRSYMHPGRLLEEIERRMPDENNVITIPVMVASSVDEAEDILDALEDDVKKLPDGIAMRAFNNVLFVDIQRT